MLRRFSILLATAATTISIVAAAPSASGADRARSADRQLNRGPVATAAPPALEVNGGWVDFSFGSPGTVGFTGRYDSASEVWLRVTDSFCAGDEFLVLRDGIALGNTSVSTGDRCDDYTDNPRRAEVGREWSSGGWIVPPGRHVVTVIVSRSDIGSGSGLVRVDSPAVATARLTGAAEVPGPGDIDGSGRAGITLLRLPRTICYTVTTSNVGRVIAGHIHRGVRGVAGPIVFDLQLAPGTRSRRAACLPASRGIIDAVAYAPWRYYVNVHSVSHPNGAVRGQLVPPY